MKTLLILSLLTLSTQAFASISNSDDLCITHERRSDVTGHVIGFMTSCNGKPEFEIYKESSFFGLPARMNTEAAALGALFDWMHARGYFQVMNFKDDSGLLQNNQYGGIRVFSKPTGVSGKYCAIITTNKRDTGIGNIQERFDFSISCNDGTEFKNYLGVTENEFEEFVKNQGLTLELDASATRNNLSIYRRNKT